MLLSVLIFVDGAEEKFNFSLDDSAMIKSMRFRFLLLGFGEKSPAGLFWSSSHEHSFSNSFLKK